MHDTLGDVQRPHVALVFMLALSVLLDAHYRKCRRNLLFFAMLPGLFGCAANNAGPDEFAAGLTPPAWRYADTWIFLVVDDQQRPLGEIVLLLTATQFSADSCAQKGSMRAVVISNSLDLDFGFDLDPAFTIHDRWLRIDLTAAICDVDHILYGEINAESASGFFNYSHPLGGYNIGTFSASPATSRPDFEEGSDD